MNYNEEMKGFKTHALVTIFVLTILIAVNLVFVPEFLWFVFTLLGMSIGLAVHYYFGIYASKILQ